ncbi:MAG: glycosyltransferase [Thermoleophilia bacterium]
MRQPGKTRNSIRSGELTRVDLHLHSRFSTESDLWILRQAGIGESNTDPETVYKVCKERGMTYVTLTDHNTIEGGLRLQEHEDFFLSEEVTTYFPGEDVKLHLLALGIDEKQHGEIQELRRNLYELVRYLNQEGILYVLSHPLTRLGGELTPGHIERLMLLFPIWEVHNGSTLERENSMSRRLAERCSRELIQQLAEKHNLEPVTRERISFTAGSDDHGGFDLASAWTVTAPTRGIAEFLEEVRSGRTEIDGSHGSTLKLAHTMFGLLAHGVESLEHKEKASGFGGLAGWASPGFRGASGGARKWMHLASLALGGRPPAAGAIRTVMGDARLRKALLPLMAASVKPGKCGGDRYHDQVFSLVNAAWASGMGSTISDLSEITFFNAVDNLDKIGRLVALQTLLLPHSLSANYHSRQRHFLTRLDKEIFNGRSGNHKARQPRVGLFTDTYDEVNGVTSILRRLAEYCQKEERPLDIICAGDQRSEGRVVRFPAVAATNLPEYGQLNLSIPPVLEVVKHCEEQEFDLIHAATPGPMGLTAFLASRILQLPFVTSYHTDIPRCVGRITDDKLNEEVAWTYTRWFYRRSDLTFAPSVYTSRDLAGHGLDRHKMAVLYQGIDADRFSPEMRSRRWRERLGGGDGKKVLLFVGRLSREKDLRFLAECYLDIRSRRDDVHLAIVGDGPERRELEDLLGDRATFTGWLEGEELAAAFASADLFVFPSSVDTAGQVILEAQASGLPVVLCDEGGACENIIPGRSGLTASSRSLSSFTHGIEQLLDSGDTMAAMSVEARRMTEARSWEKVFADMFDTYAELVNWWQPLSAVRTEGEAGAGRDDASRDFFLSLGRTAGIR